MPKHRFVILAFFMCLSGCQLETSKVDMIEVLRHENGLIMNRPKGYDVQKTSNGFALAQSGNLRAPLTFSISLSPEGSQPKVLPKWFGLFGLRERVDESEGGSGGSTFTLIAMYPAQNCWLVLSATQQAEYAQPSFLEAWAVLDHSSMAAQFQC